MDHARNAVPAMPSLDQCRPPAPPIGLAVLLNARANPLQSSVSPVGISALRKVVQKPLFEIFDETAYQIRPPTQMMRLIDSLRYHKPTADERAELNLCSSTERLYLHVLSDILVACGARKGFRFTSDDINRLRSVAEAASTKYDNLDIAFKNLPLEVTQYKFPPSVRRIEDDPSFRKISGHDADTDTALAVNMILTMQTAQCEDPVRARALEFQWLAREYIISFKELRSTALHIRRRFRDFMVTRDEREAVDIGPEPVEAEFEAKASHPFPAFLFHLIQLYHREQRKQATEWNPSCPEPPVDSIGIFAVYLSHVLLHRDPLNKKVLHSFEVLLQVLKLSYQVDMTQMRIVSISHPDQHTHSQRSKSHAGVRTVTNITLCAMIYEFLSTVRELRLVSRQKDLLPSRRHASHTRRRTPRM